MQHLVEIFSSQEIKLQILLYVYDRVCFPECHANEKNKLLPIFLCKQLRYWFLL